MSHFTFEREMEAAFTGDRLYRKPRRWTSWRVCPNCGSRATKIFHLNDGNPAGPYECQICKRRYNPPPAGKDRG